VHISILILSDISGYYGRAREIGYRTGVGEGQWGRNNGTEELWFFGFQFSSVLTASFLFSSPFPFFLSFIFLLMRVLNNTLQDKTSRPHRRTPKKTTGWDKPRERDQFRSIWTFLLWQEVINGLDWHGRCHYQAIPVEMFFFCFALDSVVISHVS